MSLVTFIKEKHKAWRVPGLLVVGVLLLSGAFSNGSLAQSASDLSKRLNRLENEIQTLSRAVFRGEEPPPGSFSGGSAQNQANFEIRLQQMEQELQSMRGKLEEVNYENRQLKNELQRVTSDLELRVNDLERGGQKQGSAMGYTARPGIRSGASASEDDARAQAREQLGKDDGYNWDSGSGRKQNTLGSYSQSASNGNASQGADPAAATYENAFAMLKNNQYDAAEKEFQAFLNAYPNHILASNAKYWLGETFYVRGSYENAARLFAEGYQQFPDGAKAADNLLKLGMSLSAMGKKDDACIALEQIGKDNFSGSGPVMRRAQQEKQRLGCAA